LQTHLPFFLVAFLGHFVVFAEAGVDAAVGVGLPAIGVLHPPSTMIVTRIPLLANLWLSRGRGRFHLRDRIRRRDKGHALESSILLLQPCHLAAQQRILLPHSGQERPCLLELPLPLGIPPLQTQDHRILPSQSCLQPLDLLLQLLPARSFLGQQVTPARSSRRTLRSALAMSGVGAVLRATGEREQAAKVLTFALGHVQLPAAYSIAARPALEALEAELPPEQLAAVRLAAAATSLEDLITQALEPTA
jgi:hypothetical protein